MLSFYLHCVDRVDRVGRGFREVVLLAQSLVQIKVCDESFHFKMREAKHFGLPQKICALETCPSSIGCR